MKKGIALFCGLFLAVLSIFGQQIPNDSFENWTNMGTYDALDDWSCSSEVTVTVPVFGAPNVFKDNDAHSGSYSARLQNIDLLGMIIPGGITLGTIEADIYNQTIEVYGGVPFEGKPDELSVWMKSDLKNGDSATVAAIFTKWNGTSRDTVSMAVWGSDVSYSDWTNIIIPTIELMPDSPDSVNVIILSSIFMKSAETTILVDDVTILLSTGVINFMKEKQFSAFYNRSSSLINTSFSFSENKNITLSCYDIAGRLVYSEKINGVKSTKKQFKIPNSFHGLLIVEAICSGERFVEKVMVQ